MMRSVAAALLCLVALVAADHGPYHNYKVYNVKLAGDADAFFLRDLEQQMSLDFWTALPRKGEVKVMVSPTLAPVFELVLRNRKIEYSMHLANAQEVADRSRMATREEGRDMDWEDYHDTDTIYAWLDELEATYDWLTTETIGQSYEGRDQRVAKICRDGCGTKKVMYIEGTIHAREWMSPAVVTYFINELTVNADANMDMLENLDWYILPIANPDGYEYTKTDRFWRKTRSPNEGSICIGTDPNRNWDFQYGGVGQSSNPCSDSYSGSGPASEVEIANLQNFILANNENMVFFQDVHSAASMVLFPWGYSPQANPDYDDQLTVFSRARDALAATNGYDGYVVGDVWSTIYPASGIGVDWGYGAAGVKYSTTVELRGDYGFDPPPSTIILECEEMWAFHRSIANDMIAEYVP